MKVSSHKPGTASWVDLASTDQAASAQFYADLFGWEIGERSEEGGGYQMWLRGQDTLAGLGPVQMEGQPTAWTCYVTVEDADATTAAVTAAGGQVYVPPMDVMDVGRMAVYADTTGAAFAVWQPRAHKGADIVQEPGSLSWIELVTREPDKAKEFYKKVFNWDADTQQEGDTVYTQWMLDGDAVAGMFHADERVPAEVPNHWMPYFEVSSAQESVAKATELGAQVVVPLMPAGPGIVAQLIDPIGAAFSIIEITQP